MHVGARANLSCVHRDLTGPRGGPCPRRDHDSISPRATRSPAVGRTSARQYSPCYASRSVARATTDAAIASASSSGVAALAAIIVPSEPRVLNSSPTASMASRVVAADSLWLRSQSIPAANSPVGTAWSSRKMSRASSSTARSVVPVRSLIMIVLATGSAAGPATPSRKRVDPRNRAPRLSLSRDLQGRPPTHGHGGLRTARGRPGQHPGDQALQGSLGRGGRDRPRRGLSSGRDLRLGGNQPR